MGADDVSALRDIGELLASLREPEAPKGLRDALAKVSMLKSALWDMSPKNVKSPACQEVVWEGKDVDLTRLPIQTCWPGDVAPLLTWGLVITRGPNAKRQNLGIYRQQLLGPNKLIMRWLSHRGGALDFRDHAIAHPGTPFPIAVALGADPATTLGAVTPVPDSLSEYQFAGLLRGSRTEVAQALGSNLSVPAWAEIVLEGHLLPASDPARRRLPCPRAPRLLPPPATRWRWKAPTAITPATTTSRTGSRSSRWNGSRCGAIPSITPPTPASRRTSRPCWAWR